MAATSTIAEEAMTDEEATPLHWMILDFLKALLTDNELKPTE